KRSRSVGRRLGQARGHAGLPVLHEQVVLHVDDARNGVGYVLGEALGVAAVNRPRQDDDAAVDAHVNVRGVEPLVVGQAVVNLLVYALVGASVVLRPAPAELARTVAARLAQLVYTPAALGVLIAEPRAHFVRRALPPGAPTAPAPLAPHAAFVHS